MEMEELQKEEEKQKQEEKKIKAELARVQKAKIIKIISVMISFLLIAGLMNSGWWFYRKFVNPMIMPIPSPTPSPTPTPEPQINLDESTWKTYENKRVGYKLKYPDGWVIEENSAAVMEGTKIKPVTRALGIEINSWLMNSFNNSGQAYYDQEKEINGIVMLYNGYLLKPNNYQEAYQLESSDGKYMLIIELKAGREKEFFEILTQILSTFELTNVSNNSMQENAQAVGWKTIENYYYSIDIPETWNTEINEDVLNIKNPVINEPDYWSVKTYELGTGVETVISEIGAEYESREENREMIEGWEYAGIHVVITTPQESVYYSDNIVIKDDDDQLIFLISSNGNQDNRFSDFWRSFKLK